MSKCKKHNTEMRTVRWYGGSYITEECDKCIAEDKHDKTTERPASSVQSKAACSTPRVIYLAGNKTSCVYFESKDDADTYASSFPATVLIEVTPIEVMPDSKA